MKITGASFTAVTSIVNTLALGSRFTPPPAVPPSSSTWNVNVVYGLPLALPAGVNVRFGMSATVMNWPAVTAVPLSFSVPAPGSVVICTRLNALAGMSSGSVNPKSAAANT